MLGTKKRSGAKSVKRACTKVGSAWNQTVHLSSHLTLSKRCSTGMAKRGRSKATGNGKGKEKVSTHQPDVVGQTSPQTGSEHNILQTINPAHLMQPILDSAGVRLATFMKSVQQETALTTENPVLNRQQSFEAIQTMLHVSVSCPNSYTLRTILTPAVWES